MNTLKTELNTAKAELDRLLEKKISERTETDLGAISRLQTRIRNLNNKISHQR